MIFKKYFKESLKKKWQKRLPFWVIGGIIFIFLLKRNVIIALNWVVIFILIDEKIKEGYYFNIKEVLTPITHEFLILITVILSIFVVFVKKISRRKK